MDQNNNGGPAFARPASSIDREAFKAQPGMTLRDGGGALNGEEANADRVGTEPPVPPPSHS